MKVMVVGPKPPPVDGRAQATSWLIDALRNDNHALIVFNTHTGAFIKGVRCLCAAAAILLCARVDRVVVVASGGSGLLLECPPLLAARIRRLPTTMTHHSARYIRERSRLFRWTLAAAGTGLRHAVLDDTMGRELSAMWRIDPRRVFVVDNAGLMPRVPPSARQQDRAGVVHLSNLSAAKGLNAVLEVAEKTAIPIRLIGTVSAEAEETLARARELDIPFDAVGPRYGDEKMQELMRARCFLFLSSYQHEAQPLVLYEAMSVGCVPLAWNAGWVGEQMVRIGLKDNVFTVGDIDGVAAAVAAIVSLDETTFAALSDRVRVAFEEHQAQTARQYNGVIA